jgi:hypothetical protein
MNSATINLLIWILSLIIGGIIAAINSNRVNDATEKVEAWIGGYRQIFPPKVIGYTAIFLIPLLWVIVKFSEWTDSFTHNGLKSGVRVAVSLYLITAWGVLFFMLHSGNRKTSKEGIIGMDG